MLPALAVFLAAYTLNLTWISVFYHRALCHGALTLHPRVARIAVSAGPWIVGIDAKAWVCMHRLHHDHSDTEHDPHSPLEYGVLGVAVAQLRSYQRMLARLMAGHRTTQSVVADLDFKVHPIYRKRMWWAPYVLHLALAIGVTAFAGWAVGVALLAGLSTHPVQGWMVNSLAHRFGGQRYGTGDNSRNNLIVAALCFGEGLQNNHHHEPNAARFSQRWTELDAGWWVCRALMVSGLASAVGDQNRG